MPRVLIASSRDGVSGGGGGGGGGDERQREHEASLFWLVYMLCSTAFSRGEKKSHIALEIELVY